MNITESKEKVTIPEGVTANIQNDTLNIKGAKGEINYVFSNPKIKLAINGNIIEIFSKNVRRKDKALMGTWRALIKNMIKGVTVGFEYKMKTVFSHFPIKTSVEGNEFVIQNFLGERAPRKANILQGVNVEVKGEEITVRGIDKGKVGQTVANIEKATKVKYRDIRVFQDGVYRTQKGVEQ